MRTLPGQLFAALRTFLVLTVLLGLVYPLLLTGIAQVAFPSTANGSMVKLHGKTVGSALIGQSFLDAKGNPLPQWFQPRASNAGAGYDPTATAASNRGPEDVRDSPRSPNSKMDDAHTSLLTEVCTRSREIGAANGVDGARPYCGLDGIGTPGSHGRGSAASSAVPPDAVTASSSGLDPHISPEYAKLQVRRVAQARGLSVQVVLALVENYVQGRTLGFLGAPRVNVLMLNLALSRLS